MSLFARFKTGLSKTHNRLVHEIKRIATSSPKLEAEMLEDLEVAFLGADFGIQTTDRIVQLILVFAASAAKMKDTAACERNGFKNVSRYSSEVGVSETNSILPLPMNFPSQE